MRRTGLILLTLMAMLAVTFAPAFAVTDGTLDGEGHPEVLLLVMDVDGDRHSAAAGPCSSADGRADRRALCRGTGEFSGMRVFTESDVEAGSGSQTISDTCRRQRHDLHRGRLNGTPIRCTRQPLSLSTMLASSSWPSPSSVREYG